MTIYPRRAQISYSKSPVRWAGGKSRLAPTLLTHLPADYNRYIEPFAGSAAVFFALAPKNAVIADVNTELINFFRQLAFNKSALLKQLINLRADKNLYYWYRESNPMTVVEKAVRFAYLNRLCWNGVYRVNRDGKFNVPIGSRLPKQLWDPVALNHASLLLRNAEFKTGDFEETLDSCKEGDFVFIDPPYPKSFDEGLGFNRYSENPFLEADHKRLCNAIRKLNKKRVKIMVTISNHKNLVEIYNEPFFTVSRFKTNSLISCAGTTRGKSIELIMRNYTR